MQGADSLHGRRVLIIEDEWLVAMEMEAFLTSIGCTVLGPASTIDDATTIIAGENVEAALLDLNLNGVSATGLATQLAAAGARVIVITGYGAKLAQCPERDGAILLEKPVDYKLLVSALRRALA